MEDVLLFGVDNDVLVFNLGTLLSPLQVELLDVFPLLVKLDALVVDKTSKSLDLGLNIGKLVLGDLQVSL